MGGLHQCPGARHTRTGLGWRGQEAATRSTAKSPHHSDRGIQYQFIRYTQRLESLRGCRLGVLPGDSYDNAMAEALNSLFKAEVVYRRKAWAPASALEVGVLEWVHRYNTTRIHSAIGYTTRCEAEAT